MSRAVRACLWIVGVGVAAIFLKQMLAHYGGGGYFGGRGSGGPAGLPASLTSGRQKQVADSLTVELRSRTANFDSVFVADITITNRSASPVRDVAISCTALGDDGGSTGRVAATLRGVFAPHATRTESNVELRFVHRPASARCAVADFTIGP
jgi:hypothetical protein